MSTLDKSSDNNLNFHLGKLLKQHPELKIEQDNYNINVTSNSGKKMVGNELEVAFLNHKGANLPAHLYFHLPLCNYICHFCNYVKKKLPDNIESRKNVLDQWVNLLIEESSRHLNQFEWIKHANIESFYIGGGTAAVFQKDHLEKLLNHVRSCYKVAENAEFSLEGNPDNFTNGLVEESLKLGFNRFSLGVQSLQDEVLKFVGRGHDAAMCIAAIERLKKIKKPFNVDYMFGMPHQKVDAIKKDINTLIKLEIPTITIYRLRNADRQAMGIGNQAVWNNPRIRDEMHSKGLFPSLEETYQMREAIVDVFLKNGYYPSPCGWWSKPTTYQTNGNIPGVSRNKWQRYDTMLAYGPGAYGWLTGDSADVIQTHNISSIPDYVKEMEKVGKLPLSYGRHLTQAGSIATRLGFGFKANQPIVLSEYRQRFGLDLIGDNPVGAVIHELLEKRFMEFTDDRKAIHPTLKGEALHEEIISVYIHNKIGGLTDEKICNRFC